ncbi:hypothetical protein V1477_009972, partial [Vespula maculifrons]
MLLVIGGDAIGDDSDDEIRLIGLGIGTSSGVVEKYNENFQNGVVARTLPVRKPAVIFYLARFVRLNTVEISNV